MILPSWMKLQLLSWISGCVSRSSAVKWWSIRWGRPSKMSRTHATHSRLSPCWAWATWHIVISLWAYVWCRSPSFFAAKTDSWIHLWRWAETKLGSQSLGCVSFVCHVVKLSFFLSNLTFQFFMPHFDTSLWVLLLRWGDPLLITTKTRGLSLNASGKARSVTVSSTSSGSKARITSLTSKRTSIASWTRSPGLVPQMWGLVVSKIHLCSIFNYSNILTITLMFIKFQKAK